MIPVRIGMAVTIVACWDACRLLLGRIEDVTTALLLAPMAGVLAWRFVAAGERRVQGWKVAAGLTVCAVSGLVGPALLQIGTATTTLVAVAFNGTRLPRLPLAGLVGLMLPILPTLDFLLAYPLRRVSAIITVALLRMNGVDVGLDGIALEWRGQQLLFDGPCSGVRMLWAALVLASLISLVGQHSPLAYARTILFATVVAVLGNALRAGSLFYVENGYIERLSGPIAHEAVGLLSFAMIAVAVVAATRLRKHRA